MAAAPPILDRRFWLLALALALGVLLLMGFSVRLGAVPISAPDLWAVLTGRTTPELEGLSTIVWQVRMPRVLLGALVGSGLAAAGVAWQGVLRNPLADPYLIGASAGGALGAAGAILFGWGPGAYAVPVMAFVGSLAAVALVVKLAHVPGRGLVPERLVLAGVAVSAFLSALLSLAAFVRQESFMRLYFWLVGGLSGRGWEQLAMLTPYMALAVLGILYFTPRLNLLQLGAETAHGLGVDVGRAQAWVIGLAALLTAAIVSVAGMIGFVGLIVPHLARLLVGPDLRRVLPASALLGALLLVGADLAARTLWAPVEVPVGVLTAMTGAPFFLYLLTRTRA